MHFAKRVCAIVLVLTALLLSGCVYLRLLQLKGQLAEFDRHFSVDTSDGLTLAFKNPVLLDEDVEGFFKWRPATRQRVGTAERWNFRWIKERVEADGSHPPTELSVDAYFADQKLTRLHASESFFAASMPKAIALAALKSLGRAKVNKANRRADSTIDSSELEMAANDRFLTEEGIASALGAPISKAGTPERPEWHYRFNPATPEQRFGDGGVIHVTFTFDAATRKVQLMKGKSAFGSVVFDTTKTGDDVKGTVSTKL